eukprot:g32652.t1
MSMRVETLYEVLGTNAHASAAEVKAAFKRQALVLHPDKGGSKEAFQRALRAFEVLSDDSSRSEYDQRLQKASRNRWSFQKTGAAGGQSRAGREAWATCDRSGDVIRIEDRIRRQRSRSSDSASLPRARALVLRRRRSACALCRPNRPGPGEAREAAVVSLCIQSLCMTARKVRELDRAVDILLMLMSIKQKMGGIVDPSAGAQEMGLRFQVMMCMRFWVRPPLHTPQQAKLEDALQAWSRLTRFRSPLGQGARGFARMDLKELEDERDGRQLVFQHPRQ